MWMTWNSSNCRNVYVKLTEKHVQKEMATHSSDLAWRIPGTGEPGGLLSMASSDMTEATSQQQQASTVHELRTSIYLRWIIEKTIEFQRNIYFCFIDYTKAFDYVDHNKL